MTILTTVLPRQKQQPGCNRSGVLNYSPNSDGGKLQHYTMKAGGRKFCSAKQG